jgi:chemotaxis protein methyltransferase WspC
MDCVTNFSSRTDRVDTTALGELLAEKLGLDAESMGPSFLSSVARRSLHPSGYADLSTFVRAAAAGGEVWQKLVENVVVSETWFFRDEAPFDHIVAAVQKNLHARGTGPIRLLSCPCSTGEEAYSIAIALTDAGIPSDAFTIDAADVNPTSLKVAHAAIYRSRSFRGNHNIDRAHYFQHESDTKCWRLKPAFRAMVKFRPANLVLQAGLEHSQPYDFVLCRNLLIYLHAQARADVMAVLRRLLTPDGILIVGHAEPAIAREHGFASAGDPRAFAFTKTATAKVRKQVTTISLGRGSSKNNLKSFPELSISATHDRSKLRGNPASRQSRPIAPTLETIRKLGDAGRTEEAIQQCRNYVRRVPDSADGYFLLGVLCGAMKNDSEAETALRRALYLEPDHAGALMHLSHNHHAKGDTLTAARLRARADRIVAQGSKP